jgi:hypothetical protein
MIWLIALRLSAFTLPPAPPRFTVRVRDADAVDAVDAVEVRVFDFDRDFDLVFEILTSPVFDAVAPTNPR